jgi:aminoglycoside phosphotransferase (APT) family kinase protein
LTDDMHTHLLAYYTSAFSAQQNVSISPLSSLSTGWETEVYAIEVEYGPAQARTAESLVLRIYPGDDAKAKATHEYHSLRQLHQTGYPVPQVLALECDASFFGRPFVIMERVKGRTMWPLLFGSTSDPQAQQKHLALFCQLFVRLHSLDGRLFDATLDTADSYTCVDRWLSMARNNLARFPRADFGPLVKWLEARRDELPCLRPAPIHGDFHPDNVLLRDDGSPVVIDWTGFGVSDSRFDLAWTLLLANAYLGPEWRDRILHEYERQSGTRVEHIETFEVFACARRLFDLYVSLVAGAEKQGMRPDAAAIMKQQMEAHMRVYDFLRERTGIRIGEIERLFAQ